MKASGLLFFKMHVADSVTDSSTEVSFLS